MFELCRTDLKEDSITLYCCNANAHVQFIERGIRFIKERIRCVRSMIPKEIKKILHKLIRELVFLTVKMVNSIRRPGCQALITMAIPIVIVESFVMWYNNIL